MANIDDLSFEAALQQLEDIIRRLEAGDVELEESITLYERGAKLKSHCESKLKAAKEKIEKVVLADGGATSTEPASFD